MIMRISDYSAGQPVGTGKATSTDYGLVKAEKTYTESDFTISHGNTGGTLEARLTPYQDYQGNWFVRGRIDHNSWTSGAVTSGTFTITGIAFDATSRRGVSTSNNAGAIATTGYVNAATTIAWGSASAVDRISVQIVDVPLTSKPTWAD
jgi:hypothetical protein